MATEESPSLGALDEPLVSSGPGRLFTVFVSGTFVPSIPQVSNELQSTDAAISLAVSLSVFATAIGSLFWPRVIAAGVIGDIFELEKHGTAIRIFFGAVLLGPALTPLAGGTAAQSRYSSWRHMQSSNILAITLHSSFALFTDFDTSFTD